MENIKSPPEKLRAKRAKKMDFFAAMQGEIVQKRSKKVTNIKIPELKILENIKSPF